MRISVINNMQKHIILVKKCISLLFINKIHKPACLEYYSSVEAIKGRNANWVPCAASKLSDTRSVPGMETVKESRYSDSLACGASLGAILIDRKSTRLNSSHT